MAAVKLNRSGAKEMKLGKTIWVEAFVLLLEGEDEDGNEIGETVEPFRTREKAEAWARDAYPGIDYKILPTWVDKTERFKGSFKPRRA